MKKLAVNYHLTRNCNMQCKYCFATFEESEKSFLTLEEKKHVILKTSHFFDKMTFVGGEPLLDKDIIELIKYAKSLNMTTMLVTNGSLITEFFLKQVYGYLDWFSVSIDSLDLKSNEFIGRKSNNFEASEEHYRKIFKMIKKYNFRTKINTVVSRANHSQILKKFIKEIQPERWKIFQVLQIKNVNDKEFEKFKISNVEFKNFIKNNIDDSLKNIAVPETNDDMESSYYMINPQGKMFDNAEREMSFSQSLLETTVDKALSQINICENKFFSRGGGYDWNRKCS